jgi:hypothetical protein
MTGRFWPLAAVDKFKLLKSAPYLVISQYVAQQRLCCQAQFLVHLDWHPPSWRVGRHMA